MIALADDARQAKQLERMKAALATMDVDVAELVASGVELVADRTKLKPRSLSRRIAQFKVQSERTVAQRRRAGHQDDAKLLASAARRFVAMARGAA